MNLVTSFSHFVIYKLFDVGDHKITITYDSKEIPGSPFIADAQPPRIFVRDLESVAIIGRKHVFSGK